ncbi:MAG: 6-carboxytetrahydropterin synthase [Psychromonas sp.]
MKLFVRDLTVIDATYLDAQRGFVGESYIVDVVLTGALNEMSMILDFSLVKKQIKAIIDAEVDHTLIVPHASSRCSVDIEPQRTQVNFKLNDNSYIQLRCPSEAFCLLESETVSIEVLETYLENIVLMQLPENIGELSIKLRSEVIDTPAYHYTHGLKKHDGNCQRIAHGHRSKLDIFINGEFNQSLVQDWANRWQDIYLLSADDIVDKSSLSFIVKSNDVEKLCSAYHAPQGYFELLIPAHRAEILPKDTTVEELAQFICEQTKKRLPDDEVLVYAYEGVGKGAIFEL